MPSAPSAPDPESAQSRARECESAIKRRNDPQAMVNLAEILFSNKQNKRDVLRAQQLLQRAIKQHNDPTAMNNLALHYLHHGTHAQRQQVIPLLERSLSIEEDSIVLRNLSDAVKDARCGTPNARIALQLCERALRFGDDPKCMEALAYNLLTLRGIHSQSERAVRLYKHAIQLSRDAEAMNRLGVCYVDGTLHLNSCSKRAAKWFERAIRAGDLPEAKCNLAYLLAGNELPPSRRDPFRAVQLLEDACKQARSDVCMRTLAKIYRDVDEVHDMQRCIELLQTCLNEFESSAARVSLLDILLGFKKRRADAAGALRMCEADYERTRDVACLRVMSCILWSGARGVRADARRALRLMKQYEERLPEEMGAMRYHMRTDEQFEQLIERVSQVSFYSGKLVGAVLLSEMNDSGRRRDGEQVFRQMLDEEDAKIMFAWLPLSLRVGRVKLPFDGEVARMTDGMKVATHCYEAVLLNLASVLLESDDKGEEVVSVLESAMETELRVIAMVNLGYVLWTAVGGVARDRERARELLEMAAAEEEKEEEEEVEVEERGGGVARRLLTRARAAADELMG
eukprot:TRINITY_DN178_c0_g3_i1.p1 TRINITY_DN178_c0_g3~~TRINITY_DN178_c0_g3_i1.p1  ORF type:complete len:570 (+),score=154.86 TRINITY_DN178_c0_g3_i1:326-2035(+)